MNPNPRSSPSHEVKAGHVTRVDFQHVLQNVVLLGLTVKLLMVTEEFNFCLAQELLQIGSEDRWTGERVVSSQ